MYDRIKESAKNFREDNAGQIGAIDALVGICITVIILIALFEVIPIVGHHLDEAASVESGSDWNYTENEDLESGVGLWESIGPLITLAAVISVLGVVLAVIMMLRGPREP